MSANSATLSISRVEAQQVLDSRGYPTIRVILQLADGRCVDAAAPAGASTGVHEAVELRDGGGFAPPIAHPEEALDLIVAAIGDAGYRAALNEVAIALDPAANGFRVESGYEFAGADISGEQLLEYYQKLVDAYPIRSIEDGFAEDDDSGWVQQYGRLADSIQLVGDDLYVTDPVRIADGAARQLSNAVLIKPNQIGTVSQTFEAIRVARQHGMACMISHRSGETTDSFIADLAVGTGVGQIKSGAPARGERVSKYNRLAEIAGHHPQLPFGLMPTTAVSSS